MKDIVFCLGLEIIQNLIKMKKFHKAKNGLKVKNLTKIQMKMKIRKKMLVHNLKMIHKKSPHKVHKRQSRSKNLSLKDKTNMNSDRNMLNNEKKMKRKKKKKKKKNQRRMFLRIKRQMKKNKMI